MKIPPILFVDQYAHIGGGQRSLLALMGIFAAKAAPIEVLAPGGGDFEKELHSTFPGRVNFHRLPEVALTKRSKSRWDLVIYAFYCVWVFPKLFLAVRRNQIICTNAPRLFLPMYGVSLLLKRRYVYYVRLDHSGIEKRLISIIARSSATHRVIANSSFTAAGIEKSDPRIGKAGKLRTIHNCIYPPFATLAFQNRFEGDRGHWNFGLFGRVSPEKGHHILPLLAKAFPGSQFYIVGVCLPEEEAFLREIVKAAPAQIHYEGFTNDLAAMVDQLGIQISLVPSVWEESFGLVAVESMAMSCLTIVARRGGLTDIAEATGCWSFDTEEDCLRVLGRLNEIPPRELAEISKSQYARALEVFSLQKFKEDVLDAFLK